METTKKQKPQIMVQKSNVDELFTLVRKDKKVHICVGESLISNKTFKNYKEANEYIKSRPYELIINCAVLFMTFAQEQQQKQQNNETK